MTRPWKPALLLGALLAILVVWLSALQPWDPDTWWHLRTGRLILETRSVPRADPYSYVLNGGPWVTFEWLSEVIFYGAWRMSPAWGLEALKALLAIAAALGFWLLGGAGAWTFGALSLGLLTHHGFLSDRPQLFDYALLPVFLLLCRSDRPTRRHWLVLPAAVALWANLHGGAAILGAGVVAAKTAAAWLLPGAGARRKQDASAWAWLVLACAAAVFVNPHGLRLLSHTSGTLLFRHREVIGEWKTFQDPLSWDGLFLACGAAAAALSWRRQPLLALCAAAFGVLSLSAVRHLFLYMLTASALIGLALEERFSRPRTWTTAFGAAAAVLAVCAGFYWRFSEYQPGRLGDIKRPEQAVRFLDENNVEGRMLHSYGLGGYLIGRCWPRRKVFVDGRNVEYGTDFIAQAIRWHLPPILEELDRRWSFDYALVENSQLYRAQALDSSPRWALVFWDDAGLAYLKREERNASLIARKAYALLQPNRPDFSYLLPLLADKKKAPKVLAEIDRGVAESPENINARQMKAFCLDALSRPEEALAELKRAAELFPDKPGPHMSLGWWYERRGRLEEARSSYEAGRWAALRSRDFFSEAFLDNNLAMVHARLGRDDEAVKLLRRCLYLVPKHPRAAANLERLERKIK